MLAPFALVAFAFAAAAAADPAGPRLLNVQELVTPDDYPRTSLVNEEQGSVTVKVKVDKNGVVTSCKVTKSSGHVALDEQTCALFRARARFDPATDRKGRARAGDFTQQITWKLADSEPITVMPRQAWMVRSTIGLTGRGAFVNCTMETSGIAEEPKDCELMKAVAKAQAVAQASPADIAGFAITEVYFYPVDPAKAPEAPRLQDAEIAARQVSRIVIEGDGRVSECEGLHYSGAAAPEKDACALLRHYTFQPAADGTKTSATIVISAYARKLVIS